MLVYVLYSYSLDRYYCGQTQDLDSRLIQHNAGRSKYTKKGIPWVLAHKIICSSRSEAIILETKIKKRGIRRYLLDHKVALPAEESPR